MIRRSLFAISLLLAGCAAQPPPPRAPSGAPALQTQTQAEGDVTVTVGVLTDAQAEARFGVDLASQGLQAVWLQVRNGSDARLRLLNGAIDPDLYSADEVAFMLRDEVGADGLEVLRQRLRD